ncbi:MAG: class I SAM-dependent methyltransferase [Rikenellaceae bacterium]|nr:class I SAM-dependent methyltransferase [Rikenellaceae bacterium]
MDFTGKEIERYIEAHTCAPDPLLDELERETNLRVVQPRMLSGKVQGKLLETIVRMVRPRNVLEIGTFTGYSTLCLAAGLPEDGYIDTVEIDDELYPISSSFIERSPYSTKIRQYTGSALEIVPRLRKIYDLVFIDGDKREYPDYYRMLWGDTPFDRECVGSGTYIIADNILWYGKVAFDHPAGDRHTAALKIFNDMVTADDRVENVILSVRDGLNIIRVK